MDKGWIKLHRSLLKWEWYEDHNCLILLVHLLVTVNYEDKKWKGILVNAGSRITSWDKLENEIKSMTKQQIRTAMTKLENSGEITRKVTNKYQLITLVKWDKLQSNEDIDNIQNNTQITDKQHSNNIQITPTKEYKEYKEVLTHAQKLDWFKQQTKETKIFNSGKYPDKMFIHFTEYWTAKKPNGTKMAYEMQKTFGFQARLMTWVNNDNEYKKL
jgi:hypothetical protein